MRAIWWWRCLAAVIWARLLIRLLPVKVALRWGAQGPSATALGSESSRIFDPLSVLALAASRIPGTTCLPRALAARSLLAQVGRKGTLVFGVRRLPQGRLDAHAWVEEDGVVVFGGLPDLGQYDRLPSVDVLLMF